MGRGGKGGRPKTGQGEQGTRQIRVFDDLADKLSWIVRVLDTSTAQLLDPMIRADIESLYQRHEPAILRIKAAEEALKRAEEEAASQANQPAPKRPRER